MSRLPIRVRITAAFALAMLLVLVAAATFVYLRQRADLTETIDHGLARRSDDVAAVIRRSNTRVAEAGKRGQKDTLGNLFDQRWNTKRNRRVGTHPACVGAEVVVEEPFMVLSGEHRDDVLAVSDGEEG